MLHEVDPRIFRHVARFVHRAILKAAEQRYESMAEMFEAARASWERLELEQGRDFMVQWRRDLSRALKAGAHQQPQRDTVALAMGFSTDLQAPRTTQIGGLTPPLPLTGTRPVMDELPYQTTTPVSGPGPDTPRRRSSPPVVVMPPLDGPSNRVTPVPMGPEVYSASRITPTAAQSATLALAEQVTRTASIGIVDTPAELPITPRSPEVGDASGGLSVAPVSHSSMPGGSLPLRAAGIPGPWFSRVSVRVVVALGASLGLMLGIAYSIAASRVPESAERPSVSGAAPEAKRLAQAGPTSAAATSPSKRTEPAPAVPREEPRQAAAEARATESDPVPLPEASARVESKHAPQPKASGGPAASASRAPSGATASSRKAPAPTKKPERESWLKPSMIYYPDDPMPLPAKPRAERMPSSGLD